MRGLIVGDFLEVVVEGCVKPSCSEVGLSVVGETFAIELVLKMLKSEGIVENADCWVLEIQTEKWNRGPTIGDSSITLDHWPSGCNSCESSKGECVLHSDGLKGNQTSD